jgi:arylsulfatase A-like enzyme
MGTLSNNSGLLQGFDIYFEAIVGHDPVSIHSKWSIFKSDLVIMRLYNKIKQARDPALVNTLARSFIREMKDRPFFLMVHYYATHTPYDPPEPYKSMYDPGYEGAFTAFTQAHHFAVRDGRLPMSDRDLRRIIALYDGGVTFQDDMIAELYGTLEEEGVLDRTLIIFTSDHGEELYDHAVFEHDWMFNTNQLVPLIIRFPGGRFAGERVKTPVALIDLLPTVMEATGISPPEAVMREVDGRSLYRLLEAAAPEEPHYRFCENNRYLSVQDDRFKLIRYRHQDREEPDRLYHIEKDPGETVNVIDEYPGEYDRLSKVLDAYDLSMPADARTYESDPELRKRLFELGYIQGNAPVLEGELERRKKQ